MKTANRRSRASQRVFPPGLSGNLTGIPFCPEADIEASRGVSGAYEEEHPLLSRGE